jgi:hypothetical protein
LSNQVPKVDGESHLGIYDLYQPVRIVDHIMAASFVHCIDVTGNMSTITMPHGLTVPGVSETK